MSTQRGAPDRYADRLTHNGLVSSFVPAGYECYLRVLNPARDEQGHPVRWSSLVSGESIARSDRQWNEVVARSELGVSTEPAMGTVDRYVLGKLFRALDISAQEPVYTAIWVGYADVRPEAGRRLLLPPAREMVCSVTTPADLLASTERVPLHIWPADLAWAIGNDVYARSVFVGCAGTASRVLLEDDTLDAFLVRQDDVVGTEDL